MQTAKSLWPHTAKCIYASPNLPIHPTSPFPTWYPCLFSESVLTKAHFLLNIWFRYHPTGVCWSALCGDLVASAALIWTLPSEEWQGRRGQGDLTVFKALARKKFLPEAPRLPDCRETGKQFYISLGSGNYIDGLC